MNSKSKSSPATQNIPSRSFSSWQYCFTSSRSRSYFAFTDLFSIVAIVPGFDRDLSPSSPPAPAYQLLLPLPGNGWRPDLSPSVSTARSGVLAMEFRGASGHASNIRAAWPLGAQLQNVGDDRIVIELATIVATVDEHTPGLFAQVASGGIRQKRFDRRPRVADHPGTRLFCCSRCCVDEDWGKPARSSLLVSTRRISISSELILTELG